MEGMNAAPASVTPETSAPETGASDSQESGQTESHAQAGHKVPSAKGQAPKAKAEAESGDELEEIALGSIKAKLPKNIAKAVKDLERGFHMKAQDAAKARRELEEMSKADVKELIRKRGLDPEEWAESTLAEKLELLAMTPEQKELKAYREEKARREKEEAERLEAEKKDKEAQDLAKAEEDYSKEIAQAFGKVGLPPVKLYFEQIAAMMYNASVKGKDLSAEEAASKIKAKFDSNIAEYLRGLDAKSLRERLGDKRWNELREEDLKRVTESMAPPSLSSGSASPGPKPASKPKQSTRQPMTPAEYEAYMERLKNQ